MIVLRPSSRQQYQFFHQLHAVIKTGLPLISYFDRIREGVRSRILRGAIDRMQAGLERGESLGEAFSREKGVFTSLQVSMMMLGEQIGELERITLLLAEHVERSMANRRRVITAVIYPIILLFASILLPPLFILIAQGALAYFSFVMRPIGIIFLIVFALLLINIFQPEPLLMFRDLVKLNIPFVGGIVRRLSLASFCRAYSLSMDAGADLSMILRNAVEAVPNHVMRSSFRKALSAHMFSGEPLAGIIPLLGTFPFVAGLFKTGLQTGETVSTLRKAAEHLEDEAKFRMDGALRVLPVLLVIIMAVYIGFIVISFWKSIYAR